MLTTAKSRVVVSQPYHDVWTYEHYWQTGLSSCFDNCAQCAFAFFCYWCFMAQLFRRVGDCFCLFLIPCSAASMRSKLRTAFRIEGSIVRDCVATCCCPCCSAIQMKNELDLQDIF